MICPTAPADPIKVCYLNTCSNHPALQIITAVIMLWLISCLPLNAYLVQIIDLSAFCSLKRLCVLITTEFYHIGSLEFAKILRNRLTYFPVTDIDHITTLAKIIRAMVEVGF